MNCPVCKKKTARENPDFPFCSPRCRLIDLGEWAAEKYVISTSLPPEGARQAEEEEEGAP
jgi:endogenous inhibitor of DNA gyrase (YacG/DUF329 family)